MENTTILKIENLNKSFSSVQVLKDVFFELKKGEVHALIGANGAGKSTMLKILTGAHKKTSGNITFDGKEYLVSNPQEAKSKGINAVYQEFSLINQLSIAENIFMGRPKTKKKLGISILDKKQMYEETKKLLSKVGLSEEVAPNILVKNLSVAQKQMVEIAKAISNNSKVLIMDEPTASLADKDIEKLFDVINELKSQGISVIYVSHRLEEIPQICDRVTTMRDGRYIKTLNIDEATKEVMIELMVGNALQHKYKNSSVNEENLLKIKGASSPNRFENINFELKKGEILGITGLTGAGRTELARSIFGVDPLEEGEIYIEGKKVAINSPRDAISHRIGFVTEDRKEEGLVLIHDLLKNISLTTIDKLKDPLWINKKKELELSEEFIKSLRVKANSPYQLAKNLSGGNQQKVVLAKWLSINPKILILDEPTRGIDVGAKGQIYSILNDLVEKGIGVIIISSEIPEILDLSDRILVMANGRITKELNRDEATQNIILHHATEFSKKVSEVGSLNN